MNTAEMKAKCVAKVLDYARWGEHGASAGAAAKQIADAIAALPVEADSRDAEIAELTKQRDELAASEARYAALQNRDAQILSLAAENRAFKAQIAALREALGPFSSRCESVERFVADVANTGGSPLMPMNGIRLSDFRRARRALAASEPKGEGK